MKKSDVKWLTLENLEGTRTSKQHGYIPTIEKYSGNKENKMLCSKGFASDDGEWPSDWNDLDGEKLDISNACKKCLLKFNPLS